MKTRSGYSCAILMAFAAALIGIASSPAIAGDATCPCFDATELKQDGRFVEEMATNEGVQTWRELEVLKRHTEDKYTAYFAIETFTPDDTETHAGVNENPYQGWLCFHSFYYLDSPVHPTTIVSNITEEESAACVAEMTAAFGKLVKDDKLFRVSSP